MAGGEQTRQERAQFRVVLEARVVESFRGPWAPLDETFADPGVAADFVGHIGPSYGPTIIRAIVSGGSEAERSALAGDWLCDDTAEDFGHNALLGPSLSWDYGSAAAAWSEGRPLLDAWEWCENARWLLRAAGELNVDRRLVALAACDCGRMIPALSVRSRRILSVTEAWARGEAKIEEIVASILERDHSDHSDYVANYAAEAAVIADGRTSGRYAAKAVNVAAQQVHAREESSFAAAVRRRIPTIAVLRAARAAQPA